MDINDASVDELIDALAAKSKPKWVYNQEFDPEKSTVFYRGPYYDSNEIH